MRTILVVYLISTALAQKPSSVLGNPAAEQQQPVEVKPEDKCSVEGTILNGATGEPLGKASISLWRTDQQGYLSTSYGAKTDSSGQYKIGNVDPGKYMLNVRRNGFVGASYGVKGNARTGPGTILNLNARSAMKNIDVKLTPQGVVIGRVVDEDGDPVAVAQLRAMQPMYQNGRKTLRVAGYSSTNDKGEYRIFGLAPGRYYVAVVQNPNNISAAEIRSDGDGDYAPVFYPATTSVQTAMQVDVAAGRELSGIDVRLSRVKLPRVSGVISGRGRSGPTTVALLGKGGGDLGFEGIKNTMVDAQGRFVFRGVTPGRYTLTAMHAMGGQERLVASTTIDVTTQNVENIQLALAAPNVIPGTVRVEGRQDLGDLKSIGLRMGLYPLDGGPAFGSNSAMVKDDGTFELRGFGPDRYQVAFFPPSESFYVKAVRIGSTEMPEPLWI